MELIYLVLFACMFTSVACDSCIKDYGFYLIGFTMIIMFITIICLSVALYMVKNNRSILGISIASKPVYLRQESTQGVTVCNYTASSVNNINDQCRNGGSSLTVNSDICGLSGAETLPRVELRDENKLSYMKKHFGPTIPTLQKEQMDNLIKEVLLNKKNKTESATLKELEALTNPKLNETDIFSKKSTGSVNKSEEEKSDVGESLYENTFTLTKKNDLLATASNSLKKNKVNQGPKDDAEVVEVKDQAETKVPIDNDEQEVYDTVPNRVRCISDVDDGYVENIPVYDLPPTRSWESGEGSNVVLDHDTDYLLLLSKQKSDDSDKASYINAKCRDSP